MIVVVINTGTELLLGHTVNTHLAFFGRELFSLGLRVSQQVTVPDGDAIGEALADALRRADVVLVTGGLGPTTDDITREITAELLGLSLLRDEAVLQHIAARFARRGIVMTERVSRQAMVPEGAEVLQNAHGTAPGLYLRTGESRHVFLLPGPPRELKPMFTAQVVPILKRIAPPPAVVSRSYSIYGMAESTVEAMVGDELLALPGMELGYCVRLGEVEVRCICPPESLEKADKILREKFGAGAVRSDGRPIEQLIVEMLIERHVTLSTAESCTGGVLAHRITNVPGASGAFRGGFVSYANEVKTSALGVDTALIARHGAVSEPVAAAMAEGARTRSGADFALATTGIAGPSGGTVEKPVGTLFIALASARETRVEHHHFPTDRESFKVRATNAALDLLRRAL